MKIAVLYHADSDGFSAAYAAHHALSERHELLFKEVQYGEPVPYQELHDFAPDQVYILDFSYKAPELRELMGHYPTVVIDHHRSAVIELSGFSQIEVCSFFEDEQEGSQYPLFNGVRVLEENAGCMLAWLFFCPNEEAPEILHYVQDSALGRYDLESSAPINAFIKVMPRTFDAWSDFYTPLAYDAGKAILAFQEKQQAAAGLVLEPRWRAVDFGFGYQKTGDPSSDTLYNMMQDYEAEIARLRSIIYSL